jgi:hypothetical protein
MQLLWQRSRDQRVSETGGDLALKARHGVGGEGGVDLEDGTVHKHPKFVDVGSEYTSDQCVSLAWAGNSPAVATDEIQILRDEEKTIGIKHQSIEGEISESEVPTYGRWVSVARRIDGARLGRSFG